MNMRAFNIFFVIFAIFALVAGIMSFTYTAEKCGIGAALLLGDRGPAAAALGFCDQ